MRRLLFAVALLPPISWAHAAPPDWSTAHEFEVRLSSFSFAPDKIEMKSGETYRLHLVNTANGGHNFDAAKFFSAAQVAPSDQAKIRNGAIEVKKGQAVDIRLVAPAPGAYKLRCSHFLHSGFGMTGEIIVR